MSEDISTKLQRNRDAIDAIDHQVVDLLNKRVVSDGGADEAAVLSKVAKFNQGPLSDATLQAIYWALMIAGLDPAEPDVSAAEHDIARHAAFVEFGARLDAEVGKWCAAQAVDERALAAALGMAARDEREGRETMATLLLTLLAAADDFGAFAGYMAGEAERQGYEPQAPPHK